MKLRLLISSLLSLGVIGLFTATPARAAYDPFKAACDTTTGSGDKAARASEFCRQATDAKTNAAGDNSLLGKNGIIVKVVQVLTYITAAISVMMIIIGGFRYVITAGDANGIEGAKNTILYAIIGFVLSLFAQIIVSFVLSKL